MRARLVAATLAVLATACGGTTLASLCERTAKVNCQKLYECAPSAAAQQGFTSEADCVTKTQAQINCAAYDTISCTGLDLGPYNTCLDDLSKTACTATTQPASCMGLQNPTQSATCTSTDGRVVCTSASAEAGSGGCTVSRSGCSDKKAYAVTCAGSSCTCTVDGRTTKTYSGTCGSDSASLNANCGFNLR